MSQNERKPQPISFETPKKPEDRIRLIQELQRSQVPAGHTQKAQPLTPPTATADAFAVNHVNRVAQTLAQKSAPVEVGTYARLQGTAQSVFGNSNDIEVLGNPWKVISFSDALPALFEDVRDAAVTVPEKAVRTEHGALFEMGLTPKGAEAPTQKRAVLVNALGKLAGAECLTPHDATRLLSHAKWLLPEAATRQNTTWTVSPGVDSAFTLELNHRGGKVRSIERLSLDNFGRITTRGRRSDIIVANYFLDRFEAAV
jgi:hypothetical protein